MSMTDPSADEVAARRIAAEVRAEMFRQKVTQRELASRIGWRQPRLARRLTAKVAFRSGELASIADALGTYPGKFLEAPAAAA